MKKIILFLVFLCTLCGCAKSVGSFQEGTLDLEKFSMNIMDTIKAQNWKMAIFADESWSKRKIEKEYQLDMTNIEDSCVKGAFIEAELSEVAIFKVSKANEISVKEAIQYRMEQLTKQWETAIQDANKRLKNVKQGRIGEYYYFILGEDCKKVVNYIRSYE